MARRKVKTAISVESYKQFIIHVLEQSDGIIEDERLDELIVAAYTKLWSPTDKRPWGNKPFPKWKQNVASAKSALDRTFTVIKYESEGVRYRVLVRGVVAHAALQWAQRVAPDKKPAYEPLIQPKRIYKVPEVEV